MACVLISLNILCQQSAAPAFNEELRLTGKINHGNMHVVTPHVVYFFLLFFCVYLLLHIF